ncbi:type II toxin-antitoxin system HicA family toxin [Novosphingobium huizhouense]|uniref:type II toxin-antitoxin system HicA family toxin n=1 Tax=Novosphingobium huizhouense TaxID=2866625 RepID=UPI001CD87E65|nr:type II toxin-antitoxin system HicA family toxin [Novosphingobium huizhouense]
MLDSRAHDVYQIPIKKGAEMKSREVIKLIEAAGWREVRQNGSHKHFRHPERPGTVTVPHPKADMAIKTLRSIEQQSGVRLR